jgi:hypothetical protein
MRRLLLPIIALLVLLLWLEPLVMRQGQTTPLRTAAATTRPVSPATKGSAGASAKRPAAASQSVTANQATTRPAVAKHSEPIVVPQPAPVLVSRTATAAPGKFAPTPPAAPEAAPQRAPAGPIAAKSLQWATMKGAPGFWQLGKTDKGVWWFVSPEGNVEFLNTVTTVQPYQNARDPHGTIFLSRDYNGTPTKPGDLRKWAEATLKRVHAAGFKGLGAWCHPVFHELPVPITRDLNIWACSPANASRLYDAGWYLAAENTVRQATAKLRTNPYLIGYFLDNEIDFSDARVGPGLYFDDLPADNPNRQEVMKVIRQLWPDINAFDVAWGFAFKSYDELDSLKALPKDPPETYAYLMSAWTGHLMQDYFKATTELVRRYDPNHLVLGIRYAGYAPPEAIRASKGLTDAQSLNYYVSDAMLDPELLNSLHDLSDQPLIISEYSFHALDGRSGNRNAAGFPAPVTDQQARADAYRMFTTRLARLPWIIGADWFQWSDEPPSGRNADGEDVNFGIVDVDDREYAGMVDAVRTTTPMLNTLHTESPSDKGKGVWRDDFSVLPTQRVPYLPIPIRINGELSDWPENARLHNMRLTQTVGLERSVLPPPNVYLGWRPEGLYVGMEIFDSDPVAAPISGRWWTRDVVELWVSTNPVTSDQPGYNKYCHQFMFVPSDGTLGNGITGAVGQWHRPGDALKDNLVPHPDIVYNCRVLNDRYVVEMLIPAASLHGWDPQKHPQLAFNFNARNYQHAAGYFWSAPKEVQTHVRPKTWGNLILESAPNSDEQRQVDNYDNTFGPLSAR